MRGIEIILKGRYPRDAWAFAQRTCGAGTLVHGIAKGRAVEDTLKIPVPKTVGLIRNLMIAAQYVHDHVVHFYRLHTLNWVDVVSALDESIVFHLTDRKHIGDALEVEFEFMKVRGMGRSRSLSAATKPSWMRST